MVEFTLSHTTTNVVSNEIKVHLDKPHNEAPYIHQGVLKLDLTSAVKLIDQLKVAIETINKSK